MNVMKIIGTLLCLLFCNSFAYGQQFLWSTSETAKSELVKIDDVSEEVLKFYDHYKFYFDGAGYSKGNFVKAIEKYGDKSPEWKSFKQSIINTEELTVFAIRGNSGKGSEVLVICVTKDNVNFITFSNIYDYNNSQIITTFGRDKFAKWFETLLK